MKERTVLIVEDEAIIRWSALDSLEDAGFLTLEACNAAEAMTMLESRSDIWAVFTDVNMPGSMDGIALASAIRRSWPIIHLLVTSGRNVLNRSDLPENARFVRKPYTPDQVVDALLGFLCPDCVR